jgi:putative PIN family toxin of toxin-antitoxin system
MPKKLKSLKPNVLFNASVIIAGCFSPNGGSGKLLSWAKAGKINGLISETILDEARRHLGKYEPIFSVVAPAPSKINVEKYQEVVVDPEDAHLLATAQETNADFLVSLDKKHVLSLQGQIKKPKIVSPKELIAALS